MLLLFSFVLHYLCAASNSNVNLHYYSEYADLKYTCDHWKYEHFFKTKESWKLQINSVAIEIQQQQYTWLCRYAVAALIDTGQDNQ